MRNDSQLLNVYNTHVCNYRLIRNRRITLENIHPTPDSPARSPTTPTKSADDDSQVRVEVTTPVKRRLTYDHWSTSPKSQKKTEENIIDVTLGTLEIGRKSAIFILFFHVISYTY